MKALVQSMIGNDKATVEAFQLYVESQFPFMEKHRVKDQEEMKKRLEAEVNKGPLRFSPAVMRPIREHIRAAPRQGAPAATRTSR